ncbi:MAG: hypothetical protein DMG94_02470 [Acidobacteria bacterium]|nr:MAG: hypothetical protein DMG94_02470 [Acidobacteriota bacterium]
MADSLYLSLWFSDFSTESMFMRALAVMRDFPFAQSAPGITALSLHPVSWTEATILEEQFAPAARPEEAVAIVSGLVHEDYAYVFEANWELWSPRQAPAEWVLEPALVRFIVRGEEFAEGEAKTQGDIEIDFGLDAPLKVLVDFINRVEKSAGTNARLLWSESGENLAQKLVSRLQRVQ